MGRPPIPVAVLAHEADEVREVVLPLTSDEAAAAVAIAPEGGARR